MLYAENMKFAFVLSTLVLSTSGAVLLTQCSSSSSDDSSTAPDASGDTSLAVCPAVEPQAADPCPSQVGLTCNFGCDTVVCVNGSWSEIGNADAATDAGSCPATPPNSGDPCTSGACIPEQICGYTCANHLGATTASCIQGQYQLFTDPNCLIDLDAGDGGAGDAGDGG
jgi:hypothetical protein